MALTTRPIDFNDLHHLENLQTVRDAFDAVLNPVETMKKEDQRDEPQTYEPFLFQGVNVNQFVFCQHEQKQRNFISQNSIQENPLLNQVPLM